MAIPLLAAAFPSAENFPGLDPIPGHRSQFLRLTPPPGHNPKDLPGLADRCDRASAAEGAAQRPMLPTIPGPVPRHPADVWLPPGALDPAAIVPRKPPMSPAVISQISDPEPGQLLRELEKRQDEVLSDLDALDAKLQDVLRGLGVRIEDEIE